MGCTSSSSSSKTVDIKSPTQPKLPKQSDASDKPVAKDALQFEPPEEKLPLTHDSGVVDSSPSALGLNNIEISVVHETTPSSEIFLQVDEFAGVSDIDKGNILACRTKIAGFMGIPQSLFTDVGVALDDNLKYFSGKWKVKYDKAPTVISVAEVPGNIWLILKAETILECNKHDLVALILNDYRFEEYDEYSALSEVQSEIF